MGDIYFENSTSFKPPDLILSEANLSQKYPSLLWLFEKCLIPAGTAVVHKILMLQSIRQH